MTYIADGPIIVVDDCESDRFILTKVLERTGLRNPIEVFESGPDLQKHMEEVAQGTKPFPALLLLDVNMPVMSGFEILRWVRDQPPFRKLPVVSMLTSSDATADLNSARELGADDYLSKQSGFDDFVRLFSAKFASR